MIKNEVNMAAKPYIESVYGPHRSNFSGDGHL